MERGLNPGLGLAILRVVVGLTFVAHGLPKIFGGMPETIGFFEMLGIPLPTVSAWFIALLETGGGLTLIVGFLVTPAALLLAIHMLAAIILAHAQNGFYVIEHGQGGIELSLLLLAALLALILCGPGVGAVDTRRGREAITA